MSHRAIGRDARSRLMPQVSHVRYRREGNVRADERVVVPAVVRYAIPEANPSLYFTMSLAITFPFNIMIGLPLYLWIIEKLW